MKNQKLALAILVSLMAATAIACNLTSALSRENSKTAGDSSSAGQTGSQTDPATSIANPPIATATAMPLPVASATTTPSPTPQATPFGGGGQIAFLSDRDSQWRDIYLIEMTAGEPSPPLKLSDNDGTLGVDTISWKPDGRKIALALFGVSNVESLILEVPMEKGAEGRELFYSDSGEYYSMPVWSPSSDELVFTVYRQGGSDVWSLVLSSEELKEIIVKPGYQSAVDWGPAEAGLLYLETFDLSETNPNYRSDLFRLPSGGGEPVLIAEELISTSFARFSPEGDLILFESREAGNMDIYLMNSDGSDIRQMTNSPMDEFAADWSPDGTKIVFTRQVADDDRDIYMMNVDGTNLQPIVTGAGFDEYPIWQP